MNKSCLVGRLTKDIESNSAGTCGSFTLAVDRKFKKDGEPTADFIRCKVFGKTLEIMTKFLSKGSQVAIEGRIQTGSYEKDGAKVFTTDVIVESFSFCGGKSEKKEDAAGFEPIYSDDDELPF